MNITTTQHAAAVAVAETIRSFRGAHPNDADRLLTQYAGLESVEAKTERIEELDQKIEELEGDLTEANQNIEDLDHKIEDLDQKIEELEGRESK